MELRDYLNVISARRWVIIQAVVIVMVTALVVSFVQPKVYQGQAKVLVSEKDSAAALFGTVLPEISSQPERGLQTQVQLMQLRPLAENTIRKLGLKTTPEALLANVTVEAIGQTNVVMVTSTAGSPEMAADIANSMAEEYVAWSQETKRESLRAAAEEVQTRLDDAQNQIIELGKRISAEGKSDELAAELQLLTGTYTTLAEKLEQLRINEQLETGSGRVVSDAVVNRSAVAPNPTRNAVLGLAMGLALGLGMAFLYEYLDDTIKSSEVAEKVFSAPVIGTIPYEKYEGKGRQLSIVEHPGSAVAESYRVLRNSLDFINFEHKLKKLLITSAAPAEGKSTVAANLAASLAQTGKRVVLVSSDFRRPTTEHFFNVNNIIGLSDVLLGTHSLKAALQRPMDDQLLVLVSGKMPPNPSELLGSAKMEALLTELEEWADWIIIDTPPLLAVADPATLARWADGVLMVMKGGTSSKTAGRRAMELLANVGARVVGVVVWGLEENRGGGYGYYTGDYYYASYYYSSDGRTKKPKKASSNAASGPMSQTFAPPETAGRRVAVFLGRFLSGLLAFLVVVVVALVALYFLDQYFGWGLVSLIPW